MVTHFKSATSQTYLAKKKGYWDIAARASIPCKLLPGSPLSGFELLEPVRLAVSVNQRFKAGEEIIHLRTSQE